ncbi:MAG: hypothetical protein IPF59_09580 [Ignavibacteria bacterium]|nr:hypothetical protein [Ignavibacteria bacterium]
MDLVALDRERFGGIPLYDSFAYSSTMGELLSIIPCSPMHASQHPGLARSLNDEVLQHGTREGARNRSNAERVEIIIHDGSVLFFCDAALPLLLSLCKGLYWSYSIILDFWSCHA